MTAVGIICMFWSTQCARVNQQKSSTAGLDCIPRTLSRAQTFDALSSQANVAGYRWAAACS